MTDSSRRFEVIVIGLGVMGSAAAYHLAKQGKRVLVLEQFELDHRWGSSYGESRIIRYAYTHPTYVEMSDHSFHLWRELEAESGRRLMFTTGGLDFGMADSATLTATAHTLHDRGIPFEWLSPEQSAARFPQFRLEPGMAALYQPDAAYLHASACVITLSELAQIHGATLRTHTLVTGIEPLSEGVRVHTPDGPFDAARLVLTGGAWSGKRLGELGLELPLQPTREQIVFFHAPDRALFTPDRCPVFIVHEQPWFYGLPDVDGKGVKMAIHCNGQSTDPDRTNHNPDPQYLEQIKALAQRYVPAGVGPVSEARVCLYTMTPDEDFVIDHHPEYPQIVFGAGFSGHGFKFGVLIGRILADLALKGESAHDLSLFKVSRFRGM